MYNKNDIILAVDYHDKNIVVRWLNCHTGEERNMKCPTTAEAINQLVDDSVAEAASVGGRVRWVMESTTGWARVKALLGNKAQMIVANVLQMPLPPKAYRRKTDKIDTRRILRAFINGWLPTSFQPSASLRSIRRVARARESLVSRRTAVRNWIGRYLAHETWESRDGLWSAKGMRRLKLIAAAAGADRVVLSAKLAELEHLATLLGPIEKEILRIYKEWPEAQWVDDIYGIAAISAVSILARIGPVSRFSSADELISFAGLAPGVRQSDSTIRNGRIGGGGTDTQLRYYIIESTMWARRIPRYKPTCERVEKKRGKKIARVVVGRLLLRSIYKMLRDGVRFDGLSAA